MKDYGQFTDSLMWSGGNPSLKSGMTHTLRAHFQHSCGVYLSTHLSLSPDRITSITEERTGMRPDGSVGPYIASQPQNTYARTLDFMVGYPGSIKEVHYNVRVGWMESYASYGKMHHRISRPTISADISYYSMSQNIMGSIQYEMNTQPSAFPQGYTKSLTDRFELGMMKRWLRGALTLSMTYILPLHFTSGKRISWTQTPVYTHYSVSNPQHYDSNRLEVTLSYHIAWGKSVRQYRRTQFNAAN